jgi:hypothetical protein
MIRIRVRIRVRGRVKPRSLFDQYSLRFSEPARGPPLQASHETLYIFPLQIMDLGLGLSLGF